MISSYYKYERITGTKAATRLVCTASTGDYQPLEIMRAKKSRKSNKGDITKFGQLSARLCTLPSKFHVDPDRQPDFALVSTRNISSIKNISGFISGVFTPDLKDAEFAYGDIYNTSDAILFVLKNWEFTNRRIKDGASIELFIIKHEAHRAKDYWQAARMGYQPLLKEMVDMRAKAKSETFI